MNKVPVKLGPLALLLTVISICLSTLAILNFNTAHADLRLAQKYAETVSTRCKLEVMGQEYLSTLSDGEIDGEADENGIYRRDFELDGAHLRIELRMEGGEYKIVSWRQEKDWAQDEFIENLWIGSGF